MTHRTFALGSTIPTQAIPGYPSKSGDDHRIIAPGPERLRHTHEARPAWGPIRSRLEQFLPTPRENARVSLRRHPDRTPDRLLIVKSWQRQRNPVSTGPGTARAPRAGHAAVCAPTAAYQRRQPTDTVLYRTVEAHLETFLAHTAGTASARAGRLREARVRGIPSVSNPGSWVRPGPL